MKKTLGLLVALGVLLLSGWYVGTNTRIMPRGGGIATTTPNGEMRQYQNSTHGFTFRYPNTVRVRVPDVENSDQSTDRPIVSFVLPKKVGTNLSEAVVNVYVSGTKNAVDRCGAVRTDMGEQALGSASFGGITFTVFSSTGVAAGNFYETHSYRAAANGYCFEIDERMHSTSIDNYEPGTVQEFNRVSTLAELESIARSFTLTETDREGTGISGSITVSPTCPVEKVPRDPACAPRPYQTPIDFLRNGVLIKRLRSAVDGTFTVELSSGTYMVAPHGGEVYPRCENKSVYVKQDTFTTVSLSCDSGIR